MADRVEEDEETFSVPEAEEEDDEDWEDAGQPSSSTGRRATARNGPELEDYLSQHLLCPISHRVMELPVISPSGHSYDLSSITEWLSRRQVDPLSQVPLLPSALYRNRALQDEIAEQLEKLTAEATACGRRGLARAAQAKLKRIQQQNSIATGAFAHLVSAGAGAEAGRKLGRLVDSCACIAAWWGLLLWEQVLVLTTSFGALACLALDTRGMIRNLVGPKDNAARSPPWLLAQFLRLAMVPSATAPEHWSFPGRLLLAALRGTLFLSVVPLFATLSVGGMLSLVQFGRSCAEVRGVEFERAVQNRWFVRVLQMCSTVTGISSLGLFCILWREYRELLRK